MLLRSLITIKSFYNGPDLIFNCNNITTTTTTGLLVTHSTLYDVFVYAGSQAKASKIKWSNNNNKKTTITERSVCVCVWVCVLFNKKEALHQTNNILLVWRMVSTCKKRVLRRCCCQCLKCKNNKRRRGYLVVWCSGIRVHRGDIGREVFVRGSRKERGLWDSLCYYHAQ